LSSQAASLPPDPLKVNKKGDFIGRRIGPSLQMLPQRFLLEHSTAIAKSPVPLFEGSLLAHANENLLSVDALLRDGAGFLMGNLTLLLALNCVGMQPRWNGFYPGARTVRYREIGAGGEAPARKTVGKRCPASFKPIYARNSHPK